MRRPAKLALGSLVVLIAGGVVWRYAARVHRAPCPAWLAWTLENPLVETVAGTATLLRRADVQPGMRVLDAGCGPGRLTVPAAGLVGATGEVVALDVQPRMLERVERRIRERGLTNVRTRLAALGEGRLEHEHYDRALLVTVLGEVPDQQAALAEIAGALRPGGVLSVTEVLPDPHYQSRHTVERLATAAGLEPAGVFTGTLAYTANFRKLSPRAAS
jgi:ubiquinone/menaquinone biosynthesis C-methylase UbiE